MKAEVTIVTVFSMQVCVPEDWTDNQIVAFAQKENPAGTSNGWFVQKDGSKVLDGTPASVACADRKGFVHRVLSI